jgi:uncharacterized membrane protein (UPF0127 family)
VVRLLAPSAQFTSFCLCHSGGSVPATHMNRRIQVRITSPTGRQWLASLASTFRDRFRGLRPHPMGRSMVFVASSVHGFGMHAKLGVIGVDDGGVVVGTRCLAPGKLVSIRDAAFVLEVPWEEGLPAPGDRLVVEIAYPDANARNSGPLRHTHRQPR